MARIRSPKPLELRPDEIDKPGEFVVSQSKVKVWRRCHQAYHFKFIEKLRKKRVKRPLQFGNIIHKMLEADAEGDDPFEMLAEIAKEKAKLFRAEQEEYGDLVDDIRQIMWSYFEYWASDKNMRFERRNGRSAEHSFNIELIEFGLGGVFWSGKIDAVGKTPNKLRWVVEHKSFGRKWSDDDRWRNLQSSTYLKANDMLGWPAADGMCWDYIYSKPPTKPSLLKNGSMSEKNIVTLPITVKETLKELGLRERQFQGFLDRAKDNLPVYFQRIHTPVNAEVVQRVMDDFIYSIREMIDGHGKVKDKNIDRHCSWCDFEPICRAQLQSLDVDYIIQREYERLPAYIEETGIAAEGE